MKKHIARLLTLVLTATLLAAAVPVTALASFSATVITATLRVYNKPSTSSTYLGSLKKGTTVSVTAYSGAWCKISYKGHTGYTKISGLMSKKRVRAYAASSVSVYRSASSSSKRLGTVSKGTSLYVCGKSGNYFLVQNSEGTVAGYVYKTGITSKKPASSASTPTSGKGTYSSGTSTTTMPSSLASTTTSAGSTSSGKIEYIIYVAQDQLGKYYSTSPKSPNTYDCATLVYYCFQKAGKGIPGSSYSQGYGSYATKIEDASDLKRGDIVCFDTVEDSDLVDHTGIYLGSGRFLHASSGAGMVIVSSLTSGYYQEHFSWGMRVFD